MNHDIPVIRLGGIARYYPFGRDKIWALRDTALNVPKATFMAICGPSGSGKSTLLNICGLIDSFDKGRYFLNGEDVGALDEKSRTRIRRQHIGFV
jgi:putative ABC transport system ATP-binding protein